MSQETITEVILATNPTVEGETTANYIAEMCAQYDVPPAVSPTAYRSAVSWKWWMARPCPTPSPDVRKSVLTAITDGGFCLLPDRRPVPSVTFPQNCHKNSRLP